MFLVWGALLLIWGLNKGFASVPPMAWLLLLAFGLKGICSVGLELLFDLFE